MTNGKEEQRMIQSSLGLDMIRRVRSICAELPEAAEIIDGFGHTVFKVRGKSYTMMGEDNGSANLHFKSDKLTQDILLHEERFYKTPYIGQHGWVSITEPAVDDWVKLEELIRDAYLLAAPKKLVKELLQREGEGK
ncbi:MmcQ/YjbR family DNA-binding protein [Paenibacillus sp. GCM10023252]|uniref:MmcQ/YjbR family DNA-binding protein n=1 Tax=Paenibacillus sp. GCM10023252 TaxID=3252649 RepID=UPI00360CB035